MQDIFSLDLGSRQARMPMTYYLAYGSNLDINRMEKRCPYAVAVGTTTIPGYRMLFKHSRTGNYSTIEQDSNCTVPAAVWRISAYDEALLDRYEGFPKYYYKKHFTVPVWNLNGNRMKKSKDCIAYVMHEERLLGEPSVDYFELLLNGYRDWGFNEETLIAGLSASIGEREAKRYFKMLK